MAHIESLHIYPLTGARELPLTDEPVFLRRSGLASPDGHADRQFVLYSPDTGNRISSKGSQAPELARVQPIVAERGHLALQLFAEDGVSLEETLEIPRHDVGKEVRVQEFKQSQPTPASDMGDRLARDLSAFLDTDVRLARKTEDWLDGWHVVPEKRGERPLHVLFSPVIAALSEQHGLEYDEVRRRLRPNVVVHTDEELIAYEWESLLLPEFGEITNIGGTERCDVPGRESSTGLATDQMKLRDLEKKITNGVVGGREIGDYAALNSEHKSVKIAVEHPIAIAYSNSSD